MKSLNSIAAMIADAGDLGCDPNSFTASELSAADPLKRSRAAWLRIARKNIKAGIWKKSKKRKPYGVYQSYVKVK